jgi:hypothetical protein
MFQSGNPEFRVSISSNPGIASQLAYLKKPTPWAANACANRSPRQ